MGKRSRAFQRCFRSQHQSRWFHLSESRKTNSGGKSNSRATEFSVALVLMLIVGGGAVLFSVPAHASSASSLSTRGLGFWVDERDLWSGGEVWNPPPTPQVFFNDYFDTPPYPSAVLFAIYMEPSGPYAITPAQEATWFSELASICDNYPNIKIVFLFFVNLSGATIGSTPDETATFTSFVATLEGHTSIYGMEYEPEYYGDTTAELTTFSNVVTGDGYANIIYGSPNSNFPTDPVIGYSSYPYYGETIQTTLPSGYVGYGYGETGVPLCTTQNPCPIWTQSVITSIVNDSAPAPFTLIYCWEDTDNPAGGTLGNPLWNSVMLRDWIWSDPYYQSNFALSGATQGTTSGITTSSTPTTTSRTSTITTTLTTTVDTSTFTQTLTAAVPTTKTSTIIARALEARPRAPLPGPRPRPSRPRQR